MTTGDDWTEGLDAEARAELYERLYDVSAALSHAATPDEVLSATFSEALRALGADAGFIGLLGEHGDEVRIHRFVDYSGVPVDRLTIPADANLPLVASAREGKVLIIESNEALECDHPGLRRLNEADHACASLPIVVDDEARGALNVAFDEAREFTPVEIEVMRRIARHCSMALARAERLQSLEEALRESRALAVHDDIVQTLATAKLHLELGDADTALRHLGTGLEAAKGIVSRLADDAIDLRRT